MEYNMKKIGERIHKLRKEKPNMTMEELASAVGGITRQTVSKWEKGEGEITINDLVKLCKIFNCDMGYLLCEYDECKTRDLQYIHDVTGLSEETIRILESWNNTPTLNSSNNKTAIRKFFPTYSFLERLISYPHIHDLSYLFSRIQREKNKYNNHNSISKEELDSLEMNKEEYFDFLYSKIREHTFKALMEFQLFLEK